MIEFTTLAQLIVATILINNILLFSFLGIESLPTVEQKPKHALKLSVALLFVLPLVSVISYLIYHGLLYKVNDTGDVIKNLTYLQTFVFVITISIVVVMFNVFIKKIFPKFYAYIGKYTIELVANTVVLGALLINIASVDTLANSFYFSIFAAFGYGLILMILTFIEKHLKDAPVPKGFKGLPMQLIILSIIALILFGLNV